MMVEIVLEDIEYKGKIVKNVPYKRYEDSEDLFASGRNFIKIGLIGNYMSTLGINEFNFDDFENTPALVHLYNDWRNNVGKSKSL